MTIIRNPFITSGYVSFCEVRGKRQQTIGEDNAGIGLRNRTADYTHRQGAGTRQLQPGNRIFGERKKKRQTDTHTNILVHRADSPVVHTDTEH